MGRPQAFPCSGAYGQPCGCCAPAQNQSRDRRAPGGDAEAKLGARLFDRKQTGYSLTESGAAIHRKAEQVEEAILSVEREAFGRDLHVSGRARLATSDELCANVIVPHLSEFRRCHPGILLEIVARTDLANLSRREADVALRSARPEQHNLMIRRAGWWKCGLYAAKSYAAAHDLNPGLRDFSNLDIITWTEEFAHFRGGPWFAEHARTQPSRFRPTRDASTMVHVRPASALPFYRACPRITIPISFVFFRPSRCS